MPQVPKYQLNSQRLDSSIIGKKIAEYRKRAGLTQTELAHQIGISQSLLSHYESGRLKVSAEILGHLAIVLQVSSDKLLGISTEFEAFESPVKPQLLKKIRKIEELPENDRRTLLKTIDFYLKSLDE